MALGMHSLARSQAQERSHACVKYFEVSFTIAVGGTDIAMTLLENIRKFIEEECIYCRIVFYRERWGVDPQAFSNDGQGEFYLSCCLERKIPDLFGVGCESSDGSCRVLQEVEGQGFAYLGHGGILFKEQQQRAFLSLCIIMFRQRT